MGFATTRWSVVRAAGGGSTPEARVALETLCSAYWYPLYAYARRTGLDADLAQDSVQGLFAALIERNAFAVADPARGRFRDFLLAAFRNHVRNEAEATSARKRGGGRPVLPLDDPEGRYLAEPRHDATPDRLYERDWAIAVLDRVLAGLREGYVAAGKEALFDALKESIAGGEKALHASRAAALGMTEGAPRSRPTGCGSATGRRCARRSRRRSPTARASTTRSGRCLPHSLRCNLRPCFLYQGA